MKSGTRDILMLGGLAMGGYMFLRTRSGGSALVNAATGIDTPAVVTPGAAPITGPARAPSLTAPLTDPNWVANTIANVKAAGGPWGGPGYKAAMAAGVPMSAVPVYLASPAYQLSRAARISGRIGETVGEVIARGPAAGFDPGAISEFLATHGYQTPAGYLSTKLVKSPAAEKATFGNGAPAGYSSTAATFGAGLMAKLGF